MKVPGDENEDGEDEVGEENEELLDEHAPDTPTISMPGTWLSLCNT